MIRNLYTPRNDHSQQIPAACRGGWGGASASLRKGDPWFHRMRSETLGFHFDPESRETTHSGVGSVTFAQLIMSHDSKS